MFLKRRQFILSAGALATSSLLPTYARTNTSKNPRRRVIIIGGGWGGLAAARQLLVVAPELEILLFERQGSFWSMPLSNKWLVGQLPDALLARSHSRSTNNFRVIHTEVTHIDRDARRIIATAGSFQYDWLILSLGIRHDYSAWFEDDHETARLAEREFPAAYTPGNEFNTLRSKLHEFKGGDWLMAVPPAPFRCPPAPYERAVLMAGWMDARKIPGRIVIIDPNPPFQEFQRIFRDRYPQRILYKSQTAISGVDLQQHLVKTEFEDFGFNEATLMPPQQAGELAWQAGLIARDQAGRETGWSDVNPLTLSARTDPHIFMIGDMVGNVSNLFGHYPKTGQLAVRQGQIVARTIASLSQGQTPTAELPDSLCHITTAYDPPATIRISSSFRQRGDGELMQQTKTERDPQPRDEDVTWLRSMYREMFGSQ